MKNVEENIYEAFLKHHRSDKQLNPHVLRKSLHVVKK